MNSAAMEYNLSRHPELYYMDVFGVIRLNEEEYKKQTEMNTMSEMSILMQTRTEADMIIRAKDAVESSDSEKDKQLALSILEWKYPNVRVYFESDYEHISVADIKAAENEHTQYVLTNI